jgi:hypothetical protein
MFNLYDSLQAFKEKENSAVWATAHENQNRLKNVYFKKLCGVLNTLNSTNIEPFPKKNFLGETSKSRPLRCGPRRRVRFNCVGHTDNQTRPCVPSVTEFLMRTYFDGPCADT